MAADCPGNRVMKSRLRRVKPNKDPASSGTLAQPE